MSLSHEDLIRIREEVRAMANRRVSLLRSWGCKRVNGVWKHEMVAGDVPSHFLRHGTTPGKPWPWLAPPPAKHTVSILPPLTAKGKRKKAVRP